MNSVAHKLRILRLQFLALLFIASCAINSNRHPAAANDQAFYNETHDASGNIRPQYEKVWQHYTSLSEEEKLEFRKATLQDFQKDNPLGALPRLLTEEEYDELQKGVDQRGRALVKFLQDHYSGKKTYQDKIIPKEVLDRIIRRSGEEGFAGVVDPERIAFPYGPDIIRDAEGTWRVLEDNPGFIGGMGDLKMARESLLNRMPIYKSLIDAVDKPEDYYKEMGRRYKAKPGKGRAVVYMIPPYADNEDSRLKKLYRDQGLQIVTPHSKAKLVTTEKGLYVEELKAGKIVRYRVGYLVLNGEHAWVDVNHPATKLRDMYSDLQYWVYTEKPQDPKARARMKPLLDRYYAKGEIDESEYRKVMKESGIMSYLDYPDRKAQRLDGLIDLYSKGLLDMNYTPGIDFIGDKEFTQYVEDIVRFYLDEEPILKNVPTQDFANVKNGRAVLDEVLLKRVLKNKNGYVIKQVDGRGGEGIWVGSKQTPAQWKKATEVVKASPMKYQVQEFKHLSLLGEMIVDIRMIAAVGPQGIYVSPTPWGRGLPLSGNGKVNISDEGLEIAVAVVRTKNLSCVQSLKTLQFGQ